VTHPRVRLFALASLTLLGSASLAFAQTSDSGGAQNTCIAIGCSCLWVLLIFVPIGAALAGMWKVFEKMGKPGWVGIVPIYNIIVLLEIIGKPIWWIVLFLIPCAAPVGSVLVGIELAKRFGKDTLFGVGLGLLGPIFFPILGFGKAQFLGAAPPAPPSEM
jgi:Family of unknown function (DUF5684)